MYWSTDGVLMERVCAKFAACDLASRRRSNVHRPARRSRVLTVMFSVTFLVRARPSLCRSLVNIPMPHLMASSGC